MEKSLSILDGIAIIMLIVLLVTAPIWIDLIIK